MPTARNAKRGPAVHMKLPKVKRAHDPVRFPDGRIRIGSVQYGVGAEILDPDGLVWRLLQLLDGTRSPDEVVDAVHAERSGLDRSDLAAMVGELMDSGYLEDLGGPVAAGLSPDELARYSRNDRYFSWVDTTPREQQFQLQGRLRNSRVTVAGLGGSGSSVVMALVAAGVGQVRCVDSDVVEESNLNRQLLYGEEDVGRPKVERAVQRLRQLNRHVQVDGLELRIRSADDARKAMAGSDLFVLCADVPHPDIQLWTNEAALRSGTPWSVCFYAGPMVTTGLFLPGRTPCYRCVLETGPNPLKAADGSRGEPLYGGADENGVLAPTAGLTGHFGALEAIYFLTGLTPQTIGRILHQNLLVYDHLYYIDTAFQPGCPACDGSPAADAGAAS